MKIVFTNTANIPEQYSPVPASHLVPEWYKNAETYMNGKKEPNGNGSTQATIKKCMPVFDAISNGYLILLPADVYVRQVENVDGNKAPYYEWSNFDLINFHPVEQAPTHPHKNNHTVYPKFNNPWGIKTPKGYSILFIQPMHRDSAFSILPGVVDTDTYHNPVNFPFVLNDITYEGLIPAGTPIAQIVLFKREAWKLKLGGEKDIKIINQQSTLLRTRFFDGYKTFFRQTKQYK